MQNSQNLGYRGVADTYFLSRPPKGTSSPDSERFEPLVVYIRRQVLPRRASTKNAKVINHAKFGNDRLRGYNVTEGRIFHCSVGMDCRLCCRDTVPLIFSTIL